MKYPLSVFAGKSTYAGIFAFQWYELSYCQPTIRQKIEMNCM